MDYVMLLSDEQHLASMPGEKAFLNTLMDACDEVDQVAFVVVMIRSDLDERGYPSRPRTSAPTSPPAWNATGSRSP